MALREILADLRVRVTGADQLRRVNTGVGSAVGGLRSAGRMLGGIGAAITSALAVRRLIDFTSETIRTGDEIGKTARRIGLAASELQGWRFAAQRSGIETAALDQSFSRLARAAFEASEGGRTQRDTFRELGVEYRRADGSLKSQSDLMLEVGDALGRMTDRTAATGMAQRLLGRGGAQLLTLFDAQRGGIEALIAEHARLGGGISDDVVAASEEAADAMADWEVTTTSLMSVFVGSFLPALTRALGYLTEWSATIGAALRRSHVLQIVLGALAVLIGLVATSILVAMSPVLIPLAALILIVDDLISLFTGGRSVIGDFLDELFGVGSAQAVVENLTAAWEWFVEVLRDAGRLLGLVNDASPPQSREARERQRNAGKAETTPDGAEARGRGRVRVRAATDAATEARGARVQALREQIGGVSASAFRGGPTVPASAIGGGSSRTEVNQRFDVSRINVTVNAAQDPDATAQAVGGQIGDQIQRALGRAATQLPQARRPRRAT